MRFRWRRQRRRRKNTGDEEKSKVRGRALRRSIWMSQYMKAHIMIIILKV